MSHWLLAFSVYTLLGPALIALGNDGQLSAPVLVTMIAVHYAAFGSMI